MIFSEISFSRGVFRGGSFLNSGYFEAKGIRGVLRRGILRLYHCLYWRRSTTVRAWKKGDSGTIFTPNLCVGNGIRNHFRKSLISQLPNSKVISDSSVFRITGSFLVCRTRFTSTDAWWFVIVFIFFYLLSDFCVWYLTVRWILSQHF